MKKGDGSERNSDTGHCTGQSERGLNIHWDEPPLSSRFGACGDTVMLKTWHKLGWFNMAVPLITTTPGRKYRGQLRVMCACGCGVNCLG